MPDPNASPEDLLLAEMEATADALLRLADTAEGLDRIADAVRARAKMADLLPALANARAAAELRRADPIRRIEILAERAARDGSYVAAKDLTAQATALRAAAADEERRRALLATSDEEMLAEVLAVVEGLPLVLREQLVAGLASRFPVEVRHALEDLEAAGDGDGE